MEQALKFESAYMVNGRFDAHLARLKEKEQTEQKQQKQRKERK